MPGKKMAYEDWVAGVYARMDEVGECVEWSGAYYGKTPVLNVPAGFFKASKANAKQPVRPVLLKIEKNKYIKNGNVTRMKCCNDKCVKLTHMMEVSRGDSSRISAERGEFSTPSAKAAKARSVRARKLTKLNAESAREIRYSSEPKQDLSKRFNVCIETINKVQRGDAWKEFATGASVFTWRPPQ